MENINKLTAVAQIKWICISRNTAIMIGPLLTVAMVWMVKILYSINVGGNLSPMLVSLILMTSLRPVTYVSLSLLQWQFPPLGIHPYTD